jgi:predicted acetyltransferase
MMDDDASALTIQAASPSDRPMLENLIQLYLHDMSEIFAMELDDNGRFAYEPLALYWLEPERRFPFLILFRGRAAGFALITRGSPMSDDPDVLDVAEFFVLRQYRRCGVGRQAAFLLWNSLRGRWIVRVGEGNRAGLPFWSSVVSDYADGELTESTRQGKSLPFRVFEFSSLDAA